jgi:hypothetical protein
MDIKTIEKEVVSEVETVEADVASVVKGSYLKLGIIIVLSIVLGFLGLTFAPAYLTSYPAIVGNVGIGLGIFYIIDKYAFKEVDTFGEIKKGNVAYAIFWLAIAIIIAACIKGS